MFSAGDLTEPINPDYMPPKAEVTYEVECRIVGGGNWCKTGEGVTDLEEARGLVEIIDGERVKTRIIRVETIRSQVS